MVFIYPVDRSKVVVYCIPDLTVHIIRISGILSCKSHGIGLKAVCVGKHVFFVFNYFADNRPYRSSIPGRDPSYIHIGNEISVAIKLTVVHVGYISCSIIGYL